MSIAQYSTSSPFLEEPEECEPTDHGGGLMFREESRFSFEWAGCRNCQPQEPSLPSTPTISLRNRHRKRKIVQSFPLYYFQDEDDYRGLAAAAATQQPGYYWAETAPLSPIQLKRVPTPPLHQPLIPCVSYDDTPQKEDDDDDEVEDALEMDPDDNDSRDSNPCHALHNEDHHSVEVSLPPATSTVVVAPPSSSPKDSESVGTSGHGESPVLSGRDFVLQDSPDDDDDDDRASSTMDRIRQLDDVVAVEKLRTRLFLKRQETKQKRKQQFQRPPSSLHPRALPCWRSSVEPVATDAILLEPTDLNEETPSSNQRHHHMWRRTHPSQSNPCDCPGAAATPSSCSFPSQSPSVQTMSSFLWDLVQHPMGLFSVSRDQQDDQKQEPPHEQEWEMGTEDTMNSSKDWSYCSENDSVPQEMDDTRMDLGTGPDTRTDTGTRIPSSSDNDSYYKDNEYGESGNDDEDTEMEEEEEEEEDYRHQDSLSSPYSLYSDPVQDQVFD